MTEIEAMRMSGYTVGEIAAAYQTSVRVIVDGLKQSLHEECHG